MNVRSKGGKSIADRLAVTEYGVCFAQDWLILIRDLSTTFLIEIREQALIVNDIGNDKTRSNSVCNRRQIKNYRTNPKHWSSAHAGVPQDLLHEFWIRVFRRQVPAQRPFRVAAAAV